MNNIQLSILIASSTVVILSIGSCTSQTQTTEMSTASSPVTTTHKTLDPATQSSTSSSSPNTQTPSPPRDAEQIIPELRIEFHTDVEDLPAGDYLVILRGDRTQLHYDALNWKSLERYPLVTLSGDSETRMGGNPYFDAPNMQLIGHYQDGRVTEALYAIDLETQRLSGFRFGCETLSHTLLPGYLATNCIEDNLAWHFISRASWELDFSRNYAKGHNNQTMLAWNEALGLLVFEMPEDGGFNSVCTTDARFGSIQLCWSSGLIRSGRTSPNGSWLEIQVQGKEGTLFGVVSTDCLRDDSQECETNWVDDAPVDRRGDLATNAVWTPDSTRILYLISECTGARQSQATTVWVYDLATSSSKVLAEFPGKCYGFHYIRKPLWSPINSELLVDLGTQGIFLLDSETGEIRGFLNNDPPAEIVGSFNLPKP